MSMPSDPPYILVLCRGTEEDVVLTVKDLLEIDVPVGLESTTLVIRLAATVTPPSPKSEVTPN